MTLTLTDGQRETLRALGQDSDALYLVRIEVGVVVELTFDGAQPGSRSVWIQHSDFTAGTAGAVAIPAESNANAAASAYADEVNRRSYPFDSLSEEMNAWAWQRGNKAFVRMPSVDPTRLTGIVGSSITEGDVIARILPGPEYLFVSGGRDVFDGTELARAGVLEVGALALERDPKSNKITNRKREVVFDWNPLTEQLAIEHVLPGRKVTITRGVASQPFDDWIPSGVYVVTDGPFPRALGIDSAARNAAVIEERPPFSIVLMDRLADALERYRLTSGTRLGFDFPGLHPLEHALAILDDASSLDGTPSSLLIDRDSFDPSDSQWAGVGHHVVSSVGDRDNGPAPSNSNPPHWPTGQGPFVFRPRTSEREADFEGGTATAQEALDELLLLIPGQIAPEEDGMIRARRVDATTIALGQATARSWDGIFVPQGPPSELGADQITQLIASIGENWESEDRDYWRRTATFDLRQAQAAYAHQSMARMLRTWQLKSRFLNPASYLRGALPDDEGYGTGIIASLTFSSTEFAVAQTQRRGFAGSRSDIYMHRPTAPGSSWYPPNGSVVAPPSWASLSSSQNAYVQLSSGPLGWAIGVNEATSGRSYEAATEIIRCDGARLNTEYGAAGQDPLSFRANRLGEIPWGAEVWYEIAERNWGGTDSVNIWLASAPVTDVTIVQSVAERLLNAHGWGFPKIEGHTDLSQLDVQVGDYVAVPLPHLLGPGGAGATQLQMVFQVLAKAEKQGRIEWTIGLVYRGDAQVYSVSRPLPGGTVRPGGSVPPIFPTTPGGGPPIIPIDASAADDAVSDAEAAGVVVDNVVVRGSLAVPNISAQDVDYTVSGAFFPPAAGLDRGLVVFVAEQSATANGSTSVEYGGEALTLIESESDGTMHIEAWYLDEAGIDAAGSAALIINHNGPSYSVWASFLDNAVTLIESGTDAGSHPKVGFPSAWPEGSLTLVGIAEDQGIIPATVLSEYLGQVSIGSSALFAVFDRAGSDDAIDAGATFFAPRARASAALTFLTTAPPEATTSINAANNSSDYLSGANAAIYRWGTAFSVAAWVKPSASGGTALVGALGQSAQGTGSGWALSIGAQLQLGSGGTFDSVPGLTANVWQHVAAVYDGTDLQFYLNRVAVGSPTTISLPDPTNTTDPFYVFRVPASSTSSSNVRLLYLSAWNGVALSGANIATLYNSGSLLRADFATGVPAPSYLYTLEDLSAGLVDRMGNAPTLAVTGSLTVGADVP